MSLPQNQNDGFWIFTQKFLLTFCANNQNFGYDNFLSFRWREWIKYVSSLNFVFIHFIWPGGDYYLYLPSPILYIHTQLFWIEQLNCSLQLNQLILENMPFEQFGTIMHMKTWESRETCKYLWGRVYEFEKGKVYSPSVSFYSFITSAKLCVLTMLINYECKYLFTTL